MNILTTQNIVKSKQKFNFITFEGIDGSGKTTQSKMLSDYLMKRNIPTIWTREIGGTDSAEKIRNIVINSDLDNISELFLIMAARKEHIQKLIKPSIENNIVVICDRYVDSSASYQANDLLTIDDIYELHEKYLENFMPSITFYIDVPYEVAHSRISKRQENDKYDYLGQDFFIKLQANYERIIEKFSDRFIRINGNKTLDEIHHAIISEMLNRNLINHE
jgi:dTMP kinase